MTELKKTFLKKLSKVKEDSRNFRDRSVHFFLYIFNLTKYNAIAWYRSWIILNAFDRKQMYKKAGIYVFITIVVITLITAVLIYMVHRPSHESSYYFLPPPVVCMSIGTGQDGLAGPCI